MHTIDTRFHGNFSCNATDRRNIKFIIIPHHSHSRMIILEMANVYVNVAESKWDCGSL
jgi:hypothetical protein